jgi:hypothetical protein
MHHRLLWIIACFGLSPSESDPRQKVQPRPGLNQAPQAGLNRWCEAEGQFREPVMKPRFLKQGYLLDATGHKMWLLRPLHRMAKEQRFATGLAKEPRFVTGHDFSRAEKPPKSIGL